MRVIVVILSVAFLTGIAAAEDIPTLPNCSSEAQQDCVRKPEVRKQVKAKYTKRAEREGLEGTVVLVCTVGIDGRAHDIKVAHSLGAGLDENAVRALTKWKFRPATVNGKPVPYRLSIETNFSLPQTSS